jgi:hypothetical protein
MLRRSVRSDPNGVASSLLRLTPMVLPYGLTKPNLATCWHCSIQNQTPIELPFRVAILATRREGYFKMTTLSLGCYFARTNYVESLFDNTKWQ